LIEMLAVGLHDDFMRAVLRHPAVMIIGGSVLGYAFGFVGGIAWCLHDYPDSPQAPLFGLFITGPIGLILGIVASIVLIFWAKTSNHDRGAPPNPPPHSNKLTN
jgi:hypothetical protein